MKNWYLVIDVAQCENCNNCLLSCKDEHVDNDWPGYAKPQPRHGHRWMDVKRHERGQFPLIDVAYRPTTCMQCQDAACAKSSNAVYRRNDGIVMIDPVKALGQRDLVDACPYHAIWWNEEQNVPRSALFVRTCSMTAGRNRAACRLAPPGRCRPSMWKNPRWPGLSRPSSWRCSTRS